MLIFQSSYGLTQSNSTHQSWQNASAEYLEHIKETVVEHYKDDIELEQQEDSSLNEFLDPEELQQLYLEGFTREVEIQLPSAASDRENELNDIIRNITAQLKKEKAISKYLAKEIVKLMENAPDDYFSRTAKINEMLQEKLDSFFDGNLGQLMDILVGVEILMLLHRGWIWLRDRRKGKAPAKNSGQSEEDPSLIHQLKEENESLRQQINSLESEGNTVTQELETESKEEREEM